jgi:hypothetical protein
MGLEGINKKEIFKAGADPNADGSVHDRPVGQKIIQIYLPH